MWLCVCVCVMMGRPQGKRISVLRPSHMADALSDPSSLYGLSQRTVAVESCFFILEV